MKIYAIIVAAGKGTRMNSELPKQFMILSGKPLYTYCMQHFIDAFSEIEIIFVIPPNSNILHKEVQSFFDKKIHLNIVHGGDTRFQSVKNGLNFIKENGVVFIHDAARPFIDKEFLHYLLEETILYQNAIPYTDLNDSIRLINEQENIAVDRTKYKVIQTPQVFKTEIILDAYKQVEKNIFTDDASVVEADGEEIHLAKGLTQNIKITTPIDFQLAELILKPENN